MKNFKALICALILLSPLPVWAAEFEKVADKDPTTIAANPFIAGAYGFIWAALLIYIVMLARGLQKASKEVADLRRKLDPQS